LVGLLKADKTDLILEFEPGDNRDPIRGAYLDIRQEPLLGAEAVKEHTGDIHVTGTVLDAENRKPLNVFTVTEGRSEGLPDTFQWFTTRQTDGTNGMLDLFLNKGRGAPAIMVEADGYVPQSSGAITGTETNLAFVLRKGSGPTGIVLKPDGQPASGATVYLADMRNGVYVQDNTMKVQERIYQGTRSTKTDEQGKFTFKARVDDYAVLILEDQGFAQVTVKELNLKPEVSKGYDFGFEQALLNSRVKFGATWFHNDVENLITFGPAPLFLNMNIGKAKTHGLEAFVAAQITDRLQVRTDYTHTVAIDADTGAELQRRPRDKTSISLVWQPTNELTLSATALWVSGWFDFDRFGFALAPFKSDPYKIVNLAANYAINENLTVFGRIDNLFNEHYQDPIGFEKTGLGVYGGIRVTR